MTIFSKLCQYNLSPITSPTYSNLQTGGKMSDLQNPERVGEKKVNIKLKCQFSDAYDLLLGRF